MQKMLSLPVNLGFRCVWSPCLQFRVLVNKRKSFWGISARICVTKWYVFISFAYPYATKIDAVVTRMIITKIDAVVTRMVTFLRIRMLQKWMQWFHGS